ncbi:MAG: S8 family serine peptidase [Pseudomonadota bacterium]
MRKTVAVLPQALLVVIIFSAISNHPSFAESTPTKEISVLSSWQSPSNLKTSGDVKSFLELPEGLTRQEPCDLDSNWALRAIHLKSALLRFEERNQVPGQDVVVAHIDTGISPHPALLGARIDLDRAYNFIDHSAHVFHRFTKYQFPKHGHGTETLSLIAAPRKMIPENKTCISGVAPFASFIPLLATDSAIIGVGTRVAKAVVYAVDQGAHVINISLGDILPMPELYEALRYAKNQGVIVIAAAGNGTGWIPVFPGVYPSVIAVGGVSEDLSPWGGATRGSYVAWSAPANGVPAAFTNLVDKMLIYSWGESAGTSDATAMTSGIATLWLSYHGREALLARYGRSNLSERFRQLVESKGVWRPQDWPKIGYGAGIVDADKVLAAPL